MCRPHRQQASSHNLIFSEHKTHGRHLSTVGAGLLAKNDNAVYLLGTRHKYQAATVRYGLHATPISTICLRVGCTSNPFSRR